MIRVGVTGGIGSGKTTVCRLFAQLGVAVYNTDEAARRLMTADEGLRRDIEAEFGPQAYEHGKLNRAYLARLVFADPERRRRLNARVHPAVRADFERWCLTQQGDYVVLESALLFDAGLDAYVDRTVAVLAPARLRIERTCRRDGTSEQEVRCRMAAQLDDDELHRRADYTIVNVLEEELAPVVEELDKRFRYEARNT